MVENVTQIKSGITMNVNVSAKIRGNIMCGEKKNSWNTSTCICENGKYLGSIIDYSVIMRDEAIEVIKTVPEKLLQRKLFQQKLLQQKLFQQKLLQEKLFQQILTKKR